MIKCMPSHEFTGSTHINGDADDLNPLDERDLHKMRHEKGLQLVNLMYWYTELADKAPSRQTRRLHVQKRQAPQGRLSSRSRPDFSISPRRFAAYKSGYASAH
jgi:hypothetical protein